MSVILESVSYSTLVSAVSKLVIENNQQESTGIDTPIPKDNISDETINLLMEASSKLSREAPKEKLIPSVCTRLGKCTYCPLINKISTVKCKITNKIQPITKLPKFTTCELSDIII